MLTTNDLLTFFHVLMELTDAEVKISHVDPDDGLVELRIGGEGHQGLWLPAPAAAERIKDFLRFHYAEEDQHENLLEYLLHKSPVTTEAVWSEPVFATGGSATHRSGSVPYTDAFRAAVTNGLTKAASRLGIGIEIWKNEVEAPSGNSPPEKPKRKRQPSSRRSGAQSTNGFKSITEMREAAKAEADKLANVPEDQAAEAKQITMLAQAMQDKGLQMQPAAILAILWGPNPESVEGLPQRRVLAAHNFLQSSRVTEKSVEILNASRASVKP